MLIDASVTPLPARKYQYNTDVCTRSLLTLQTIFGFLFCESSFENVGIACKWEVQGGFHRHGRRCGGIIFRHHKIRSMTRYWKRKRLEQLLFSAEVSGCTRGVFLLSEKFYFESVYCWNPFSFTRFWAQNERVARSAKTHQLHLNRTERNFLLLCTCLCMRFKFFLWNS